ncbi:hypothetical protein CcCBS67573_g02701 [Chytriomyces confervae]|uniref:Uncharacterized protein n=1 Tax=Chytriomyces confervae TaxID=246404 RepID=A0A507FK56_9FUNG|nr:hypothetical protein HDU80_008750 [Chytriomyces hyalinus]TPX76015.1 hypothetical protein CcCBS67573_g02701 [Chytriomyces confervae]
MANICSLAPETLLVVLSYIQPDLTATCRSHSNAPHHASKYHKDIVISRGSYHAKSKIPSLIAFGSVCRIFRLVHLMHPFWLSLRWHLLLPLPRRMASHALSSVPSASDDFSDIPVKFFNVMKREPTRLRRVRRAIFDFGAFGWEVSANTVGALLNGVQVEKLESLVLDASWKTASNKALITFIALKFKSLKSLCIQGRPCRSILYGLSSNDLYALRNCTRTLAHLCLSSYGSNSFSLPSLLLVLDSCKDTITSLSLSGGPISDGGLDLMQIGSVVGSKLESLSIAFSFCGQLSHNIDGWEPLVHGDLQLFTKLSHLSLSDTAVGTQTTSLDEPFPLHILRRLLSPFGDRSNALRLHLHFHLYKLASLHVPVLYAPLADRLVSLSAIGSMRKSDESVVIRRFQNLLDSCPRLTHVDANYSANAFKEIQNISSAKAIHIGLIE